MLPCTLIIGHELSASPSSFLVPVSIVTISFLYSNYCDCHAFHSGLKYLHVRLLLKSSLLVAVNIRFRLHTVHIVPIFCKIFPTSS